MSPTEARPDIDCRGRVYWNHGNPPLIALLDPGLHRLLDIGCGAGDNAALVRARFPDSEVFGITNSKAERELAERHMQHCWTFDIENDGFPHDLEHRKFDTLLFSHVLEHVRDPATVLARFRKLLEPGGMILIAVPNVLAWPQRIKFLFGRFEYESAGVLDDTHLRFFTYFTADKYLLAKLPDTAICYKGVSGSFPLWILRRHVLPRRWCEAIDNWAGRVWPNLFGVQVLIKTKS